MKNPTTKTAPRAVTYNGRLYQFTAGSTAARAAAVVAALIAPISERRKAELATQLIHETTLSGKLDGFCSITTATTENSFCDKCRKCNDAICQACYANAQLKSARRRTTAEHATINGWILRNVLIPVSVWRIALKDFHPYFSGSAAYYRIESHGETETTLQALNYINLAKSRPGIRFAVWSKNARAWSEAFKKAGKPKNLIFVFSSLFIDRPATPPAALAPYVDHVFTVYSPAAQEAGQAITCPKRCRDCLKCYRPAGKANPYHISEALK